MNRSRLLSFAGLVALCVAVLNPNPAFADNPPDDGPPPKQATPDPPVETTVIELKATTPPPAPAPAPPPAPAPAPVVNVTTPPPVVQQVVQPKETNTIIQKAVPVHMLLDTTCLVSLDQAAKCGVGIDLSFPTGWDKLNVHLIGDIGPGGTPGFGAGFTGMFRLETPFVIGTVHQEVKDKTDGVVKKARLEVTFRLIAAAGADFGKMTGSHSMVFAPGVGFGFLCDDLVYLGVAYLEGVGARSGPADKPPMWIWGDERMIMANLAFKLF